MFCVAMMVFAQEESYSIGHGNKWDFGIGLGLSNSGTDTHSWAHHGVGFTEKANLAWNANLKYHLTDAFSLRLDYLGTKIKGDDLDISEGPCVNSNGEDTNVDCHQQRGWAFESPLYELSLNFEWEPLASRRYLSFSNEQIKDGLRVGRFARNADGRIMKVDADGKMMPIKSFKKNLSPYFTAGIGFSYTKNDKIDFRPGQLVDPSAAAVAQDLAEFSNLNIQIPIGVGLRYDLSEKIFLDLELRAVVPTNDWLDGMYYVTASNDDKHGNDSYQFGNLRVGFRMGGTPDSDGDGVNDIEDSCPMVPGLKDLNGCPDADADGITDRLDSCPEVAGLSQYNGCPDSDGDGVVDNTDNCPNVRGLSQYNGCPDTDGDGIVDDQDDCPTEAGLVKYNGCQPKDDDGDGFTNDEDACPNIAGTLRGCPDSDDDGVADEDDKCPEMKGTALGCPDNDNDGIMDKLDKCPNTKGIAANYGCPERKIVDTKPSTAEIEKINFSMRDIKFITDSNSVTDDSSSKIDEAVVFANSYPGVVFLIAGYTDSIGDKAYNQRLSERRAKRVYNTMILRGVDASRLRYAGFGEDSPIGDNGSKEGRALNRRVEISVVGN